LPEGHHLISHILWHNLFDEDAYDEVSDGLYLGLAHAQAHDLDSTYTQSAWTIYAGGIAYLSVQLDWYGKLVLGWELSLHPDTPLALASLQMAFAAIIE